MDSEEEWLAIITSTNNGKKEKWDKQGAEMEITEIISAESLETLSAVELQSWVSF